MATRIIIGILSDARWSIFTMHWPAIAFAALVGRE